MTAGTRLNLFQQVLRQWEHFHPYNAAQAIELPGPADASRATEAWHQTLAALGLGDIRFTNDGAFSFSRINDRSGAHTVTEVPGECPPTAYLGEQLNTPFDLTREPPFRPFVCASGNGHYLGLVYQHWVADSVSIRTLIREWFLRMYDPAAARKKPLRSGDRGYWMLFGPEQANWTLLSGALHTVRRFFQYRSAKKVASVGIDDPNVLVQITQTPPGLIERVYGYARQQGVKVNDVLVAAMVDLCRQFVPFQARAKRTDIAIGSIVDLRPYASASSRLEDVFNIYLGMSGVICSPRDMNDWPRLLKSVATQNRLHKEHGHTPASLLWMASALLAGRYVRPDKLQHFYRKEMPLAGGVSNVTMKGSWADRYYPDPIRSYLRVSPTGPMTPVVFTTTTLGSRMQIGMTYRRGLMSCDRLSQMGERFISLLEQVSVEHMPLTFPSPRYVARPDPLFAAS